MNRTRRLRPAALVLAFLLAATASAPPAQAQIPVTDVAHIAVNVYYQYLHYAARLLEIKQKYEIILHQAQQIEYQLQALKKLQNPHWRDVGNLLVYLNDLMREGEVLAYSLDNIVDLFRQTFPGWQESRDWPTQYRNQMVRTLNTMERALRTVNQQSRGFSPKDLGVIKAQLAESHGHEETLEILATIDAYTAEELLLVRQSLAASNNIASVYYASEVNAKAQAALTFTAASQRIALDLGPAPGKFTFRPEWWPFG
jgi:P-type conjugative transfer protein TrbJ